MTKTYNKDNAKKMGKTVDENKVVKEEETSEEKKKEIDKKQLEKAKETEEEKEVEEEYQDKAYNKLLTACNDFINNKMFDFHNLERFYYNVEVDVNRLDPHPYVSPFD